MVKKLFIKPIMSDQEIKQMRGEFIDLDHYHTVVDQDTDAYTSDGQLLFKFRVAVIPHQVSHLPIEAFLDQLNKSTSIRGTAAGKIDVTKLSKNIAETVSPSKFKSRVVYSDGHVSDYYVANRVQSLIAGYYDKPTLHEKSKVLKEGLTPCRLTAYSAKEKDKWESVLPLIQYVDMLYEKLLPDVYNEQASVCQKVPEYCIDDTIFTTLTVNYNWRTACHVDKGDLKDGYSAITVTEAGDWDGCFLGYPQYGVCINIREGDLLIKDPHQYHCNTEFIKNSSDATRITLVYYFREGILQCEQSVKN